MSAHAASAAKATTGAPYVHGIAAAVVVAALGGLLVPFANSPTLALSVAGAAVLAVAVAIAPAVGAWTWLLVCPLIVGFARGGSLSLLRPNEALLLVIAFGMCLRIVWDFSLGRRILPKFVAVDGCIILLAVAGSVVPLLLRFGRGLTVSQDDVLYAVVFWKYLVLYGTFRFGIRTSQEVAVALRLALVSGAVVAVVAILQVRGLFGISQLLYRYYDAPFEATVGPVHLRASSTIASAFGLADMMAMCLAITIGWFVSQKRWRVVLASAGVLFLVGIVAAGSFSGFIGGAVVIVAMGLVTGRLLGQLAVMIPIGTVAAVALWPVIAARLAGFDRFEGLPRSWLGRLANLETFFWPEIFSGWNWLLGVRPAARVAAPETWRNWVYIESGHTWFLWTGGIPLLIVFFAFMGIAMRTLFARARTLTGSVSVAASAAFAAAAMIFVVTVFDPHLTVRGSADLFFPLVALALTELPSKKETSTKKIARAVAH